MPDSVSSGRCLGLAPYAEPLLNCPSGGHGESVMKLGGRRLSIVPTAQHSTRGHAHPGQGKLSLGVSEPVDDENYISEVDMGFTYPATDALPSLGVELSMAHAQEAGLAGQIAPPAAVPLPRERAAKTTGLLGGARGDRNHDLMLVGVRVRKLVRSRVPGPRLVVTEYLVVGVDMVQQHAYDVEDLQGARLKTDLPRRLMRAPDELLERQGEWQPLPHQSSIVPLRPTAFFCATCMLQSSHKPCVLCSGSDGTPEHMLLNVQQFDSMADAQSGTSRGTEAVQSSLDPEQSSATVPTSSQELLRA
jgi:hypothetical protein